MLMTRAGSAGVGAKLAEQRGGQVEDAGHVRVEHLGEALGREVLERRPPRDAGVVDQDVQARRPVARRFGERARALGAGHVGRDRVDVAELAQPLRRRRQRLGLARGDAHARAGDEQAPSDHLADPA